MEDALRVLGAPEGGGAIGSALFFALRQFGMPSNRVFLVLAVLCVTMAVATMRYLRRLERSSATPA